MGFWTTPLALTTACVIVSPAAASTLTIESTGAAVGAGGFVNVTDYALTISIDSAEVPASTNPLFGYATWNIGSNTTLSISLEFFDAGGNTVGDVLTGTAFQLANGGFSGSGLSLPIGSTFQGNGTTYSNLGGQGLTVPAGTWDHSTLDLTDWDSNDDYSGPGTLAWSDPPGTLFEWGGADGIAQWQLSTANTLTFASGQPGCNPADIAEPFGVLDLSDVQAFTGGFTTGDPVADLNGDMVLDLDDVQAFISAFVSGCP
jgi:hypothetical protein